MTEQQASPLVPTPETSSTAFDTPVSGNFSGGPARSPEPFPGRRYLRQIGHILGDALGLTCIFLMLWVGLIAGSVLS